MKKKPGPTKGTRFSDVSRSVIGERLFKTRRARGFSQQNLGKKVGISKRMIAHYEGDNGVPPLDSLIKIAEALNVTVSYLLGESTQKTIKGEMCLKMRKQIEKLQKLPPKEQKTIFNMIEIASEKNKKEKQ